MKLNRLFINENFIYQKSTLSDKRKKMQKENFKEINAILKKCFQKTN